MGVELSELLLHKIFFMVTCLKLMDYLKNENLRFKTDHIRGRLETKGLLAPSDNITEKATNSPILRSVLFSNSLNSGETLLGLPELLPFFVLML